MLKDKGVAETGIAVTDVIPLKGGGLLLNPAVVATLTPVPWWYGVGLNDEVLYGDDI